MSLASLQKVVLASNNYGKLQEFQEMLRPFQIEMIPQGLLNIDSVDETGATFIENALLKARHVADCVRLPVLADDSGLEVDALGGQPGVLSARFAGRNATDADNNIKLLSLMEHVKLEDRQAKLHCVLVHLSSCNDPSPLVIKTTWEGVIMERLEGNGGFGYDSIFFVPSEGCTASQLCPERKNKISHRAKAFYLMMEALKNLYVVY